MTVQLTWRQKLQCIDSRRCSLSGGHDGAVGVEDIDCNVFIHDGAVEWRTKIAMY